MHLAQCLCLEQWRTIIGSDGFHSEECVELISEQVQVLLESDYSR